jgi:hypothetical protein
VPWPAGPGIDEVDAEGRFAGSLPPGTKADRIVDVLRERLG